ncbi:hypothetical protein [Microbacterium sp. RU33B]|uniref:hypothetical protein n=1 Tax=Microbacterium sp. RU33B TaxID=1907390 RepID=UPI00097856F9|nr:hypothetical protein [Microbacterium sp. RU33B]
MTREPAKRSAYEPVEQLLARTGYDPDMKRPLTITAGVLLVVLRVLAGVYVIIDFGLNWDSVIRDASIEIDGVAWSPEALRDSFVAFAVILGAALLIDAVMALLVYRGVNWARVLVMTVSVVSISSSFAAWWVQGERIHLDGTFLTLALDILVLLALSSRSAAAYARRKEKR